MDPSSTSNGVRSLRTIRFLRQALEDQLAHPAGVGLTTHVLHDRTDQGAGGGHLAVADLLGDVGVGLDGAVDRVTERTLVGDDRQTAGGDDLVGSALTGEYA